MLCSAVKQGRGLVVCEGLTITPTRTMALSIRLPDEPVPDRKLWFEADMNMDLRNTALPPIPLPRDANSKSTKVKVDGANKSWGCVFG